MEITEFKNIKSVLEFVLHKLERIEESLRFMREKRDGNKIISNDEALEILKVSRSTLQNWRDEGLIAYSKVGRKIFYRMEDIQEIMKNNKTYSYNEKNR